MQQAEPWPVIKQMPLDQLERNQWRLFDPRLPTPGGLRWNRFLNWITRGKTAREMLHGRFPGGPRGGPGAMYQAQQWFRFAGHSVAICPTAKSLFQRAINGTINAGRGAEYHQEFLGFDAEGHEIRYDYTYGFIDLEVILRRWPPSGEVCVLQGIILSKVMDAGISKRTVDLEQLAVGLLDSSGDVPETLRKLANECKSRLFS